MEENDHVGTVVWFDAALSYGFVKDQDSGTDYFCHYSDIVMPGFKVLKAGQTVEFSIGKNRAGKDKAINITIRKS